MEITIKFSVADIKEMCIDKAKTMFVLPEGTEFRATSGLYRDVIVETVKIEVEPPEEQEKEKANATVV